MPERDGHDRMGNRQSHESQANRQGSMQATSSKQVSTSSRSPSQRPKPPAKLANGRFEIDKKLGAGCFGEVYRGVNTETKDLVAVKFEALENRTQQLEQEAAIMRLLREGATSQPLGFPECFFFGREGKYHCLVMECLSKSLEDQLQVCGGKFPPSDTAMMAEQIVRRAEFLHSKGIIHRDIKPENFMWGTKGKIHHVFMIDFGLSKRYFDKKHIDIRDKLSLTGTARYASINAHKGIEQSRRDDLEAIGHMLLYFLRGSLPWSGLDAKTKEEKYRKIRQKKEDVQLDDLCRGFPPQFEQYLSYTRGLGFTDRPDYNMLCKFFKDALKECLKDGGEKEEHAYKWILEANPPHDLTKLSSINPHIPVRQPDDVEPGRKKGGGGGICGCFGSKTTAKD